MRGRCFEAREELAPQHEEFTDTLTLRCELLRASKGPSHRVQLNVVIDHATERQLARLPPVGDKAHASTPTSGSPLDAETDFGSRS